MEILAHGWLKLTVYTLAGTAGFFQQVGFAGWLAYPVTLAELIGGLLLLAGFHSRWIALALLPVLLGAVTVHGGNGWVFSSPNGGWEYPLYLAFAAVAQVLLGDGAWSAAALLRARMGDQPDAARRGA